MLDEQIVQRFVDRLCNTVHNNVNVMNEHGVIIASRDAHRIGVYDALAHDIVRRHKDVVIAHEGDALPAGVLPGVNVPVYYAQQIIGVVGVTGDYREVESVAYALKTALEIMVEYEAEREQLRRRQDRKRLLANSLLYDPGVRREELVRAMEHLGYRADAPRVAILLRSDGSEDQTLASIKACRAHIGQDISLPTRDGGVVVFKALCIDGAIELDNATSELQEYCEELFHTAQAANGLHVACVCGSLQQDPLRYRDSYAHALWLAQRIIPETGTRPALFFDHTLDYTLSLVPEETRTNLLLPVRRLLEDEHASVHLATLRALSDSNMSIKEAAARLDVHRNTVVLRLQRLRDTLGLDPFNRSRDRRLLELALATKWTTPDG
ncbi:MAG: CdaR family transcriptional regulator [bacterium]